MSCAGSEQGKGIWRCRSPGLSPEMIVPQAAEQIMKNLAGRIGSEGSAGSPVSHGVMLVAAGCSCGVFVTG